MITSSNKDFKTWKFTENDPNSYRYQSDDDDRSTSILEDSFEVNPMKEIEKNEMEDSFLLQSTLSNTVFLVAGSFYLTVSIWDLKPPKNEVDIAAYDIIAYLAPFTYLLNSFIDIHLANRIRMYRKLKRRETMYLQEQMVTMTNSFHNYNQNDNNNDPSLSSSYIIGEHPIKQKKKKSKRKRLRKFAAHRRDLSAAISFFLAAFASVLSVIAEWLGASDETLAGFDGLSVHLYMLSAVIAILGSRIFSKSENRCSFLLMNLQDADTLETLGDLFFLIGSFVDSVLFDFSFDDDRIGWPILSSTLWCVDALLYLNSDWIAAKSRQIASEPFFNTSTII
jgi:hypothetical protein